MIEIISVINQKGGVGKSTTAHAIGSWLNKKGFKTLFIDLDAQGNLSYTLGIDPTIFNILDVLTGNIEIKEAIQKTNAGDAIASSLQLSGAEKTLDSTGKEYKLKEAITPLLKNYDYIIIDTPPALGILTINALTACDFAIIPAQADIYSLQGIGQLYNTIETVKQYCNKSLKIKGILLTRYNSRTIISRDVGEMIEDTAKKLNTKVYKTTIRECVAIKEAQATKIDIYKYSKNNAAKDYDLFMKEFMKQK